MKTKIVNYLKAGYPALMIQTTEESRLDGIIKDAVDALGYDLFSWDCVNGIIDLANGRIVISDSDPSMMPTHLVGDPNANIQGLPERSVLIAKDFHLFTGDKNPTIIRRLKDMCRIGKDSQRHLIITGASIALCPELEKEITVISFSLPTRSELHSVLNQVAEFNGIKLNGNTENLLDAASGLTTLEAESAICLSKVEVGEFDAKVVAREKAATLKKSGILEVINSETSTKDIGGLCELMPWINKRKLAFSPAAKAYGLPTPKGMMLIGIPGCGKSLVAKSCANILSVPLLKLDAGRLFGSLVGQSEANLRSAIQTAEAIAPCVLWIDEIEKGFSGSRSSGATDGGTSSRVFGTFLSWMQDKTAPVFVVATANDVSSLPSEFLRKGRFDEIWFADLPDMDERKSIWEIQIQKHGRKPDDFDLDALTSATNGWTGSEIECLFVDALYQAFDDGTEPTTEMLFSLSKGTLPLSKTMAEQITALRQWCNGRARSASYRSDTPKVTGRKLKVGGQN